MLNTKRIKISDYFDKCNSDKTITKTKAESNKGLYPVYSATVNKPFAFINTYNNEEEALLIVNDGASGSTFIVRDEKFTIGKHVMGIRPKKIYKDFIDLDFINIFLEPILIEKNKNLGLGNLPQIDVLNSEITIPIKTDGTFDLDKQKEIVKNYQSVIVAKNKLIEDKEKLENITINDELLNGFISLKIGDVFELKKGTNKYNRTIIDTNVGDIPVYSGQVENDGIIGYVSDKEYDDIDGEKISYIRVTTVGAAGNSSIITTPFCLAQNNLIMSKNDKYKFEDIYLDYVRYFIGKYSKELSKGAEGQNKSLTNTDLKKMQIPFPIKNDGSFDLEKQIELTNKYNQIQETINNICNAIDKLSSININILE